MPLVGKLGGGDPQKRAELFNAHIIKHGVATGEERRLREEDDRGRELPASAKGVTIVGPLPFRF